MYETLIIDGIDLTQLTSCITDLSGIYATPMPRGENVVFPGLDGEVWVPKPFGSNQIDLGLVLAGSTTADFNSIYRTLRSVVLPGKKLSVVRRMSFSAGVLEQHTAFCEYAGGLAPSMSLMRFGRVTLSLKVLSGLWYGVSTTTLSVSTGTFNVIGDVRTRKMTVSMTAGTLTNTTTGNSLSYSGPGTMTVDVENMIATSGGTDVTAFMTWTGAFPMELAAGPNTFTGSGTIVYTPAYL